jgi:predicted transcriptional regulator
MQQIALRLDEKLVEQVDKMAEARDVSRQALVAEMIEHALKTLDLRPAVISVSEIASLDQTAARWGMTREEAVTRILRERIHREYVDARNSQLQDAGVKKLARA